MRSPAIPLFALVLASTMFSGLFAQQEVEVRQVSFESVRATGVVDSTEQWWECSVTLQVRGRAAGQPGNPQFVDRVRVGLSIGVELTGRAGSGFQFYQAEAEAVTLTRGTSVFRFYLPAAVVARDGMRGEPHSYLVAVSVGGKEVPLTARHHSSSLNAENVRQSFLERVGREAKANAGVLLPQYLTPFQLQYPRDTPAFLRIER
jgi:hypothetical protein